MIEFAFTECGISIEEFWELSWYEWGLHIDRVRKRKKRDMDIWEGHASLVRMQLALLANINRDPKKEPTPFQGTDFIKLSFDEVEKKDDRKMQYMSPEEVENKFGKTLNRGK